MKTKSLNPVALIGVALGATIGAVLAVVLVRRWRRGGELGFWEIPWRDLVALIGPIIALARRLIQMTRRELIELEMQ